MTLVQPPLSNGAIGRPHFGGVPSLAREVGAFRRDVLDRSRQLPVMIVFWAPWCEPCRALMPVLERVARKHAERVLLATLNVEMQPELPLSLAIEDIPAVRLFIDGREVAGFSGVLRDAEIEQWLDGVLPEPLPRARRQSGADSRAG